jgi:hypothetical protein
VEWHRGNLEAESDQHHAYAKQQQRTAEPNAMR